MTGIGAPNAPWEKDGEAVPPWPVWELRSDSYLKDLRSVIRYVVQESVDKASLRPPRPFNEGTRAEALDVLRAAYDVLLSRRITYGHEPWEPHRGGQRVRPAAQIVQDKGTCLDLALAFAGMCEMAQLRPLVGIVCRGDQPFHAIVLVDLRAPITDMVGPRELAHAFDNILKADDLGGVHVALGPLDEDRGLVAVDVTSATVVGSFEPEDFETARIRGRRWFDDPTLTIRLVDLLGAREYGGEECQALSVPPAVEAAPPIATKLPDPPQFDDYPSRRDTLTRLRLATGRIVISGERGFGKSTLAYQRASAADHGYGWFLTATDRLTLLAQLAEAELSERPRQESGTVFDRESYAAAALARLHRTTAPWVVVLDNVDTGPDTVFTRWLPRPHAPGQTLIITTTRSDWGPSGDPADVAGGSDRWPSVGPTSWSHGGLVTGVRVRSVESDDLGGNAWPDALRELVGGAPLIARVVNGVAARGATLRSPGPAESPEGYAWSLARGLLVTEPDAAETAYWLGWLPPDRAIETSTLDDAGVSDVAAAFRLLTSIGLVTLDTRGRVAMHGLLQEAVRTAPPEGVDIDPAATLLGATATRPLTVGEGDLLLSAPQSHLDAMRRHLEGLAASEKGAGVAWCGLGRLLEYRGNVASSAGPYERAITSGAPLPASVTSACWLGRARAIFQRDKAAMTSSALADGEELARRAQEVVADSDGPEDRLAAERARAMLGLLIRRRAEDFESSRAKRKALLEEAVEILVDSLDKRLEVLGDHPELDFDDRDRGEFNLGGTYVNLAKLTKGNESAAYLGRANEAYEKVLTIREKRFSGIPSPHVAACAHGLGIVAFYEAVLDVFDDPATAAVDPAERTRARRARLQSAQHWVLQGLADRELFAGREASSDVNKSTELLGKILLARRALDAPPASRMGVTTTTFSEFLDEAASSLLVSAD